VTDAPHPLAVLAHELRTPLNAIIGYADAMKTGVFGPLNAPYGEQAAIIHGAALHLLALVEDMTEVAKAEAGMWTGRLERLDPATLAGEVTAWLAPRAAAAGVALRAEISESPGQILADGRALRQILVNLLDNALKFTRAGGQVTLRLARDVDALSILVTDSGAGQGQGGQGLGLRLATALCAAMGGALTFQDAPGAGRTVTVRLPARGA